MLAVPRHVCRYLLDPVLRIGTPEKLASPGTPVPTVPEIPVAEDGHFGGEEYYVRLARKMFDVLPKPKAHAPELAAQACLTFRVLRWPPRENATGLGGRWLEALERRRSASAHVFLEETGLLGQAACAHSRVSAPLALLNIHGRCVAVKLQRDPSKFGVPPSSRRQATAGEAGALRDRLGTLTTGRHEHAAQAD